MKLLEKYKMKIMQYKFMIKPTLILTAIYFLGVVSILRANINFADDIGRVYNGNPGWENFSRYTSVFLSRFIHVDKYLTDVSPLPQLIAIFILAVSGVMLLYIISEKKKISIWQLAITLPLGLSPYFLQCLSYKYDAPYMALSIFAAIFPLLFYKKGCIKYFIVVTISMLVVCTTYQASSSIFPMLVIMLAMKLWNEKEDNKQIGKFIFSSILGYCAGLLIFKLFIMIPTTTFYVSTEMASIGEIIPTVVNNLKEYFYLITTDFKKIWLIVIAIMCCAFIYTVVVNTKRKKYFALPIAVITLTLMLFFTFGIYIVLKKPLFSPRAMYGFGAFIAFIAIYVCSFPKKYLFKLLCLLLSWMLFVFSFTYGNALYMQNKYMDYRFGLIINDLDDLGILEILNDEDKITLQISGNMPLAPNIRKMPQNYQILNRLLGVFNSNYWKTYEFFKYNDLKSIKQNRKINLKNYNLPVLKDTIYHRIKGNDKYILVELK